MQSIIFSIFFFSGREVVWDTLCCAARSGLSHASAHLRLVPALRGLFSHQTCCSAVLREVWAAATCRLPRRRQLCANVSSNSEELKLADRDLLWERHAGSRASTGSLPCGSLVKLSAAISRICSSSANPNFSCW